MKLAVRRIGNCLEVIVPKATLSTRGVSGEGRCARTDRTRHRSRHGPACARGIGRAQRSDRASGRAAVHAARDTGADACRSRHRWRRQGAWVSAYDEWEGIAGAETQANFGGDVLGRSQPLQRVHLGHTRYELIRLPLQEEVGGGGAGSDGVDRDAAAAHFPGHDRRQRLAALGRGIDAVALELQPDDAGREIDDPAAGAQPLAGLAQRVEGALRLTPI